MTEQIPPVTPSAPVPAVRHRVRVFLDFWNYELSMKAKEDAFITDWRTLGSILAREALAVVSPLALLEYQGMNVYGSYDERNPKDESLRRWASNTLDKFPGIRVSLVPRQRKAAIVPRGVV